MTSSHRRDYSPGKSEWVQLALHLPPTHSPVECWWLLPSVFGVSLLSLSAGHML